MFIYADESGNSGRNIFDDKEWYRLGAIFTVADAEPTIEAALRPVLVRSGQPRLHAKDLMEHEVAPIVAAVLDALDSTGPWEFSLTLIHKPYLATTKFVDTVFDSGENLAVRPMWYNLELFRHSLCVAIDDMMTPMNARRFWSAYLADDAKEIQACIRNAKTYMHRKVHDRRLREVVSEAFDFALRHIDQLTLLASQRRESYQGHTPNMVAFTCLLRAIHDFVDKHNSPPVAFFHDQQDEFKRSMKQTHELFAPLRYDDHPHGAIPTIDRADYDMGRFSMPSSKDMIVLQAADLLVWTSQREAKSEAIKSLQARLAEITTDFHISRRMSDMIVAARLMQNESLPVSEDQIEAGRLMLAQSEQDRMDRLRAFKDEARGGKAS